MSVLPPNPSLVAIILLIKTKHGVKHIYHYPPHPGEDSQTASSRVDNDDAENDSSDSGGDDATYSSTNESSFSSAGDDYSSSSDDKSQTRKQNGKKGRSSSKKRSIGNDSGFLDESGSTSPEKIPMTGWKATKGSKELLGLPPGFPVFLCPPTEMDKKRFEMGIHHLTFLGWPCFASEDGTWKPKPRVRRSSSRDKTDVKSGSALGVDRKMTAIDEAVEEAVLPDEATTIDHGAASETDHGETTGNDTDEASAIHHRNSNEGAAGQSEDKPTYQAGQQTKPYPAGDMLNMFHIVFVMNPPPLEYQVRVDDMYHNVVKPFSKALKREQARSNYVSNECEALKAMKARHDPASREVIRSSRLAKAISILYKSISSSRIAHIDLTSKRSLWVHIPTPTSISSLPGPLDPQLPGTWLTTATAISSHDELLASGNKLTSQFALLLLADVESILESVSPKSRIRPALEQYLSHTSPAKSFLQVSQKSKIVLEDIMIMATHLTHWRQARIIPPLRKKDTYIMSPNADMRRLKSSAAQFQRDFPLQPPLSSFLARLNSASRPYRALIPNKDHKEAFMDILAWLMRYGWVTQIRTFAWVRVPGYVQKIVNDKVQREKNETRQSKERKSLRRQKSVDKSIASNIQSNDSTEDDSQTEDEHLTLSSNFFGRSTLSTPSNRSRNSVSSTLTAVPIHGHMHTSTFVHSNIPALLIPSPTEATGEHRRYLEYISSTIERNEGIEAKDAWNHCLPYFDGQHALEQIPIREGGKRSWLDGLRAGWVREGWLREGRSW